MKNIKLLLVAFTLACTFACGGGHSHTHDESSSDTMSVEERLMTKEYGSAFVCPMHCKGSGSDQPGKCPVCKMDYVANTEINSDTDHHGHDHDHGDHEGHDHD